MNNYEIEYYVTSLEKQNISIDEESKKIVSKVRGEFLKKSLLIYILFMLAVLSLVIFILFYFKVTKIFYLIFALAITYSFMFYQEKYLEKIYSKVRRKKYEKHLSKEFIERMKNEHRYFKY